MVLIDPGSYWGGMTTQGLGATDIGNPATIGGLSEEFYRRVGGHYGQSVAYMFEPHVAEGVFLEMLSGTPGIIPAMGTRVTHVTKEGATLRSVITENGREYSADVFIDATYEGDLMALAGVSYTVGRESNATYGETLNGVRPPNPYDANRIDPYVVAGDPRSGLLPDVSPGPLAGIGTADSHVQAYNYRLCITSTGANRITIEPPPGYDAARYELLTRWVESRTAPRFRDFVSVQPLPKGKYDANAAPFLSTDLVGGSDEYPEADLALRARIRAAHESYMRGYFYHLRTSTRIPASLRQEVETYGLCADEFIDNGGWPHQMYVREARRMIGRYVMTENDVVGRTNVTDSVGLGSYAMDSHYTQRLDVGGTTQVEGSFFVLPPLPYPVSYRALTPQKREATNLLVPVGLSASHVAYGSLRMEPVYMVLGHSAGTAAWLAASTRVPVQEVDYEELRDRLIAEGQKLFWDGISLTVDKPSPQRADGQVSFTAHGLRQPGEYRFSLRNVQSGTVNVVQDYGSSDTWMMPSDTKPASYVVIGEWRTNPQERAVLRAELPFIVAFPAASGVSLSPDRPSPQAAGAPVLFKAAGVGSDGYQYQFWVRDPSGKTRLVQDYSLASSWMAPASLPPGTYGIVAHVRTCSCVTYDARTEVVYVFTG